MIIEDKKKIFLSSIPCSDSGVGEKNRRVWSSESCLSTARGCLENEIGALRTLSGSCFGWKKSALGTLCGQKKPEISCFGLRKHVFSERKSSIFPPRQILDTGYP